MFGKSHMFWRAEIKIKTKLYMKFCPLFHIFFFQFFFFVFKISRGKNEMKTKHQSDKNDK